MKQDHCLQQAQRRAGVTCAAGNSQSPVSSAGMLNMPMQQVLRAGGTSATPAMGLSAKGWVMEGWPATAEPGSASGAPAAGTGPGAIVSPRGASAEAAAAVMSFVSLCRGPQPLRRMKRNLWTWSLNNSWVGGSLVSQGACLHPVRAQSCPRMLVVLVELHSCCEQNFTQSSSCLSSCGIKGVPIMITWL